MKWEQTVMSKEKIETLPQYAVTTGGNKPTRDDWRLRAKVVAEAQAEISFKAGQKEVVDFVEGTMPKTLANYVGFWQRWQDQKKKWGKNDT